MTIELWNDDDLNDFIGDFYNLEDKDEAFCGIERGSVVNCIWVLLPGDNGYVAPLCELNHRAEQEDVDERTDITCEDCKRILTKINGIGEE